MGYLSKSQYWFPTLVPSIRYCVSHPADESPNIVFDGMTNKQFELEEDVYWNEDTGGFEWVFGQQTGFHLIKPKSESVEMSTISSLFWRNLSEWMGVSVVRWV